MFGSSQGFNPADGAAPMQEAPKRRQEEKQVCVPVTVRILEDAISRHAKNGDGEEVLIHGTEVAIVNLVGVVERLVQQSAMLEFHLNDASGRMKVRYYGSEGCAGIAAGSYVSIVGNLRTSPSPHVSAMCLQAVTSANDISYHMIEVGLAALRLRNPTAAARIRERNIVVSSRDPTTPAKDGSTQGNGAELSPPKGEAPSKVEAVAAKAPARVEALAAKPTAKVEALAAKPPAVAAAAPAKMEALAAETPSTLQGLPPDAVERIERHRAAALAKRQAAEVPVAPVATQTAVQAKEMSREERKRQAEEEAKEERKRQAEEKILSLKRKAEELKKAKDATAWEVKIPETKLTGTWVNNGRPLPVTHKVGLGNDIWIVGVVDGTFLKMVKIQITGPTTYVWLSTCYDMDYKNAEGEFPAFTADCFKGQDVGVDKYPVELHAEQERTRILEQLKKAKLEEWAEKEKERKKKDALRAEKAKEAEQKAAERAVVRAEKAAAREAKDAEEEELYQRLKAEDKQRKKEKKERKENADGEKKEKKDKKEKKEEKKDKKDKKKDKKEKKHRKEEDEEEENDSGAEMMG